jgi:hypothetical protein
LNSRYLLVRKFPSLYGIFTGDRYLSFLCDNPVDALTSYFYIKIHFNIILKYTPKSSKWFFPSRFQTKPLFAFLFFVFLSSHPPHLIIRIIFYRNINYEAPGCATFSNLEIPFLPEVQIFSSAPFSQTPSVRVRPLI